MDDADNPSVFQVAIHLAQQANRLFMMKDIEYHSVIHAAGLQSGTLTDEIPDNKFDVT